MRVCDQDLFYREWGEGGVYLSVFLRPTIRMIIN